MKEQHWWKTAFSKAYFAAFNEIYSVHRGEREAAFLIQALQMKKGARILDLACGQGRHAIPLAQRGMCVTGVDSSILLLRVAKQRARIAKVNISFIKGDIRIYHDIGQYDIILILGNSFGYFCDKDNERVLSNVAASLKTGGWFVLDLSNTPGMLRRRVTGIWTQKKIPGGKITTRMLKFNPKTFQATLQWRIWQHERKTSFNGMLRLYTPPEINHLLSERGLIIKKTYGLFANKPFSIKTKRYLSMAQKIKKAYPDKSE